MKITPRLLSFLPFLFAILLTGGCEMINPAEPVPSYIEVKNFNVSSNYATQGTNSANITDVWVYADNKYLGTFELPARFPVLLDGVHELSFGAGIEANGIASTNEAYPLYQFTKKTVSLTPGQVTTIDTINVSYFSGVQYVWYEDFESDTSGGGISLDTTGNSKVNIQPDSLVVFEGKRSLKMTVNSTNDYIECVTVGDGYALTKGRDIYLEMNYKCNQSFNMGIVAISSFGQSTNPVISLNPKSEWNKIYIRLGPYINASGNALKFKIIFGMQLASGATEGTVYLDNLKLITN
ncbi:MAG: hypothetical protein U0Y08_01865 [Bacteroidia bacterium]